jgi:flagellar biosynthetic protein FliR
MSFLLGKIVLFTLVLARVSGLVMSAPIFSSRDIPIQFRALLSVAIALLALPSQWHLAAALPNGALEYLLLTAGEVLVGLCLGTGIDILLSGARVAGQVIGLSSGEALAEIYDPQTDESFAVHSQLFAAMATLVFVVIGGHRMLLAALLDTFQAIPPGTGGGVSRPLANALQVLLTQAFSLGIRAAATTLVALLLTTLVLGLVSRTLPQLNVMALGFGLNSLVTYGVLMLTLGAVAMVLQEQFQPALDTLTSALKGDWPPPPNS